jgi:hypothetical protein
MCLFKDGPAYLGDVPRLKDVPLAQQLQVLLAPTEDQLLLSCLWTIKKKLA